jgi:hypothetical protein
MMCDVDTLALLVKVGADVNLPDAFGFTPLHMAARSRRSTAALELLVGSGSADVDAVNLVGETTSLIAAANENAAALLNCVGRTRRTWQTAPAIWPARAPAADTWRRPVRVRRTRRRRRQPSD